MIAFLDSGLNPYHGEFFTDPRMDAATVAFVTGVQDGRTGTAATPLVFTRGLPYAEAIQADREVLERVERGVLYRIEGTRMLTISFQLAMTADPLLLPDNQSGHGPTVMGVAHRTYPDAVLVMVEVTPRYCLPTGGAEYDDPCVMSPELLDALAWVRDQEWIDVVSMSFSPGGNHPTPELDAFAALAHEVSGRGKLLVNSGGNEPSPPLLDGANGPPWIISVGGASSQKHGSAWVAANGADVVANFTAVTAHPFDTARHTERSGTSYASPRVAGVLAKAIARVRAEWSHAGGITADGALAVSPTGERATAWTFREALNASARLWNATDYQPDPNVDPEDPTSSALRAMIPSAGGPAQLGWGFVDNATAEEIVARVLRGDSTLPAEKEGAHAEFMQRTFEARRAYWTTRESG